MKAQKSVKPDLKVRERCTLSQSASASLEQPDLAQIQTIGANHQQLSDVSSKRNEQELDDPDECILYPVMSKLENEPHQIGLKMFVSFYILSDNKSDNSYGVSAVLSSIW